MAIRFGLPWLLLETTGLLAGAGGTAQADGSPGFRADVYLGGSAMRSFARPDGTPVDKVGVGLGVIVDLRLGHALFGVSSDVTTTIYSQHELFAGLNFGYVSDGDAEITVLGEVGGHVLRGVGRESFVEVETRHVLLPAALPPPPNTIRNAAPPEKPPTL